MCRLLAYSGVPILAADLLFRPSHSIVRQSFDARERAKGEQLSEVYQHGAINADGFGLAFYSALNDHSASEDEDEKINLPCVFTELQPAWNSKNLLRLADKVRAPLFFAHVRAAGPSLGVCDCKTHPFTFGRFTFMHNGEVAGFSTIRRRLLLNLKKEDSFNLALAHGATDTAVAFAIFVDHLNSSTEELTALDFVQLLKATVKVICDASEEAGVEGSSKLNFVVTDGQTIVATRYTFDRHKSVPGASLYYASGSSFSATHQEEEEKAVLSDIPESSLRKNQVEYRIFHAERRSRFTIVASEPLTGVRSDWIQVPDNHVVVVRASGEVLSAPFFLRYEPCSRAKYAVSELTRSLSFLEFQPQKSVSTSPVASMPKSNCDFYFSSPRVLLKRSNRSLGPRQFSNESDSSISQIESLLSMKRPALLRCSSTARTSFDEGNEPPIKKYTDNILAPPIVEIRNPNHVLSASGQVHVSAMVCYGNYLISADGGAAGGRVCIYDLKTFDLVAWSTNWGILALCCDNDKGLLFGSRSDGHTLVWDVSNPLLRGEQSHVGKIALPRIGHVLSMSFHQPSHALLIGSQDGVLRRLYIPEGNMGTSISPLQAEDCPSCLSGDGSVERIKECGMSCRFQKHGSIPLMDAARAHCGYITAVQIVGNFAFSAGSCSLIKKWDLNSNTCLATFSGHHGSVMDLCVLEDHNVLFSAALDGTVRAWDISENSTTYFLRTLHVPQDDSLSCLSLVRQSGMRGLLCAGSSSGAVWIWEINPMNILQYSDYPHIVLNVSASPINSITVINETSLAVGAGSGRISLWSLSEYLQSEVTEIEMQTGIKTDNASLIDALATFVSYRSVSSEPEYHDDCLQAASFILNTMQKLYCETRLCTTKRRGALPCALGRMRSSKPNPEGKYVFVYGHYDVVSVTDSEWETSPWIMEGIEGFLYGRGVSDDKGPCLAMLFAAAKLRALGELAVDVFFFFDGEQETSLSISDRKLSSVFQDHKDFIFPSDETNEASPPRAPECILISNNTWVEETTPCITYGMRGVIDIEIVVESPNTKNLHSGVHGGTVYEALEDLVTALHSCTKLKEKLEVHVAPIDAKEANRLKRVAAVLESTSSPVPSKKQPNFESLVAQWANVSLSVSNIRTSNVDHSFRKVPNQASARISVHFVQNLTSELCKDIINDHFQEQFRQLSTHNRFTMNVVSMSDPWVGDVESPAFVSVARALEKVWGEEPVMVREGGSYSGMTSFLEKELGAPAVHLPMAGANDQAHLHNERIKIDNFLKGREVFEEFLRSFS